MISMAKPRRQTTTTNEGGLWARQSRTPTSQYSGVQTNDDTQIPPLPIHPLSYIQQTTIFHSLQIRLHYLIILE